MYGISPVDDVTLATSSAGDFLYAQGNTGFGGDIMLDGCQGKPRTPTIIEKVCPQCGAEIEMFSIDTQMACEKCGFIAYNDTLSCVQWCRYARKCVGDEMYEHMMEIAAAQKARE
jgi:ribosomal protein S27AE